MLHLVGIFRFRGKVGSVRSWKTLGLGFEALDQKINQKSNFWKGRIAARNFRTRQNLESEH